MSTNEATRGSSLRAHVRNRRESCEHGSHQQLSSKADSGQGRSFWLGTGAHFDLGGGLGGEVAEGALGDELDGRLLAGHGSLLALDDAVSAVDHVLVCRPLHKPGTDLK